MKFAGEEGMMGIWRRLRGSSVCYGEGGVRREYSRYIFGYFVIMETGFFWVLFFCINEVVSINRSFVIV